MISGCGNKKSSNTNYESQISPSDIFTDRDLEQEVDISDATTYNVEDGEDKVQLVLDNLTIKNTPPKMMMLFFLNI